MFRMQLLCFLSLLSYLFFKNYCAKIYNFLCLNIVILAQCDGFTCYNVDG